MAKGNFGERLKRERELREVTLQEITSATRIGPRFLEALENEDWARLPGGVFNRGFVRSVARYLGLDEEGLLAEYDLAHGAQVEPAPEKFENRIPSAPRWLPLAVLVGVLVILVALVAGGVYAWRRYAARRAHRQAAALVATPLPQPAPLISNGSIHDGLLSNGLVPDGRAAAQSHAAAPAASSPLQLSVSASATTRVRVQNESGLLFDTRMHAGETHHFRAQKEFEVTAGDSGAVLVELNGQAMPPLGVPGSSGTIRLNRSNLRQAPGGDSKH